jgi:hypothetical protein
LNCHWCLCWKRTTSIPKGSIIAFYDLKRKIIFKYGSSEIGFHSILENIHAEEIAMKYIRVYLKIKNLDYTKYKKNIQIIIWKNTSANEIKPAYCCKWCSSFIEKCKFPIQNIITIHNESAIQITKKKEPLKRLH